jgi:hypothetical protein
VADWRGPLGKGQEPRYWCYPEEGAAAERVRGFTFAKSKRLRWLGEHRQIGGQRSQSQRLIHQVHAEVDDVVQRVLFCEVAERDHALVDNSLNAGKKSQTVTLAPPASLFWLGAPPSLARARGRGSKKASAASTDRASAGSEAPHA